MARSSKKYSGKDTTMAQHEDKILEGLGKLSGLVEASREDIKNLANKSDEQGKNIQNLTTCIQVQQTTHESRHYANVKEFTDINAKLGRDYDSINLLKDKDKVKDGVEIYKHKKREWWQYMLGILVALSSILFGINQISTIKTNLKTNNSAYGTTVIVPADCTKVILDTIKVKGK